MKLNFENDYYRKEAFENSKKSNYENNNTSEDAFLLILKDIKKEDLSNLITLIQQTFIKKYNLTEEQKTLIKKFFSNFNDDHNSELKKGENIIAVWYAPGRIRNKSKQVWHSRRLLATRPRLF